MKQLPLPAFADGVIVLEHPDIISYGKCEFCVPPGFEAIVVKEGLLSNLYREGDRIRLGTREGFFGIKGDDPKDTHLYICKKQINQPIKWGVGDIPCDREPGNPPVLYGANGTLQISVQNMKKLILFIIGGMHKIDTRKIGKYLDATIAAHVKTKLMESVQHNGLNVAAKEKDCLAAIMKAALFSDFDRIGIWLESFAIDAVQVMTPFVPESGQN